LPDGCENSRGVLCNFDLFADGLSVVLVLFGCVAWVALISLAGIQSAAVFYLDLSQCQDALYVFLFHDLRAEITFLVVERRDMSFLINLA
jgi:hypothetical protein